MASLFGASPFSTPVGQRIERATDGALPSENWAVNIEICDIINETEEGPKDAAKALRKRLAGNRNYKSVLLTLTVLETCVKNCGHRFHVFIAKKELLDELVKILNPKNSPPQVVQDKILALIQDWADAFRGSPDLSYVVQTYMYLKEQGVEFPAQDLDTLSPIYTPERTQPERPAPMPQSRPPPLPPTSQALPVQPQPVPPVPSVQGSVGPVVPTPEQLAKLRTEIDIVQENTTVMSEMLTEMTPGQEEPSDLQLLQELNRTCRAMQQRILELIERVANEEVVGILLNVNDDLNNVFIRYDRYERFRQATGQQEQPNTVPTEPLRPAAVEPLPDYQSSHVRLATAMPDNAPQPAAPVQTSYTATSASKVASTEDSLISFDDEISLPSQNPSVNSMTQQMEDLSVGPTSVHEGNKAEFVASADQDEEFDMFAQSRKSTFDESRKGGSSYSDNVQPFDRSIPTSMSIQKIEDTALQESKPEDTSEVDNIESWLEITDQHIADAAASAGQEASSQDTLSSSEFDKFLADRAAAGGQRTGSLKGAGASRPKQRQMQMANQVDDEMFGL